MFLKALSSAGYLCNRKRRGDDELGRGGLDRVAAWECVGSKSCCRGELSAILSVQLILYWLGAVLSWSRERVIAVSLCCKGVKLGQLRATLVTGGAC